MRTTVCGIETKASFVVDDGVVVIGWLICAYSAPESRTVRSVVIGRTPVYWNVEVFEP